MRLGLSKSRIMSGLQRPKRLWFDLNPPEDYEGPGEETEFRLSQGHRVHRLAQALHPQGILIEHDDDLASALSETKRLLDSGHPGPLFEATFEHQGVLVRTDLLLRNRDGSFDLVEVKSSTEFKPQYLLDCAVQAWVLKGAGLPLRKVEVAYLDKNFVYQGDGRYDGIFCFHEVTDLVEAHLWEVSCWADWCRRALGPEPPEIEPGPHCEDFYPCPYTDYCPFPEGPEYPLSCLPWLSGKRLSKLLEMGIEDVRDIPPDYELTETQEMVRRAIVSGEAFVSPSLREELRSLPYPRYYLDFETLMLAVPIWAGTSPYQQIPFQWSCHIETAPGEVFHQEFIDVSGKDPRENFVRSLLECLGERGPVLIYSNFEKTRLKKLAEQFPAYEREIQKVLDRMVDLCVLLRRGYCHPEMRGSWSLKSVLPTIAPELSYEEEEIQEGGTAQAVGTALVLGEVPEEDRERLIKALLSYCRLDTLALVKIVHELSA